MRQCNSCGAEISEDAAFCPMCGRPMAGAAEPRTESAAFPADAASVREKISQKVETHLVKAVIATVCCCIPLGIVSVIYAAQVNRKLYENDLDGAVEASKKADLWGNLAIGIWVLVFMLFWLFYGTVMAVVIKNGDVINYINR